MRNAKHIVDKNIEQIFQLIVCGHSRSEIIDICRKDFNWTYCDAQIDKYMRKARKLINIKSEEVREKLTNLTIARYELIFKNLMIEKNYKDAAEVLTKLGKFINPNGLTIGDDSTIIINVVSPDGTKRQLMNPLIESIEESYSQVIS